MLKIKAGQGRKECKCEWELSGYAQAITSADWNAEGRPCDLEKRIPGREKSGKPLRELNELGVEGGRGTVPLFNIQLKLNSLESLSLDG